MKVNVGIKPHSKPLCWSFSSLHTSLSYLTFVNSCKKEVMHWPDQKVNKSLGLYQNILSANEKKRKEKKGTKA